MDGCVQQLIDYIKKSTSPYHTVELGKEILLEEGFEELKLKDSWQLKRGGKYFVNEYGSVLFAFTIGEEMQSEDGFRIAAAHGDFPGLRIKPNPEIRTENYVRLNVEAYGGVNLMSWLDRPLSVAGKVALKSDNPFQPEMRLLDIKKELLTIPNIAVHLDKEMNNGKELKVQKHMLPLIGLDDMDDEKDVMLQLIAKHLEVSVDNILSYELNLYNPEEGKVIGLHDEFISSPRLDDITGVSGVIHALKDSKRAKGINVGVIFDHEEVGSRTKQGAGSMLFDICLEKIYLSMGFTSMDYKSVLPESVLLSVDVAHAVHPAYSERSDISNKCILNHGFCIKQACAQTYATDSEAIAIVQQICNQNEISYQILANHSDQKGGSTLANIMSSFVPVRVVDLGVPLLAMHSSRELMGTKDQKSLCDLLHAFYEL